VPHPWPGRREHTGTGDAEMSQFLALHKLMLQCSECSHITSYYKYAIVFNTGFDNSPNLTHDMICPIETLALPFSPSDKSDKMPE
jgi:hypothetical protein